MKTLTTIKTKLSIMILLFVVNAVAQNSSDAVNTYRVTAYQKNNNEVVSVSNEVQITPAAVIYIPNAFTPNGDGMNDTFGAIGEGIIEYTLQIFNRWGELIFESNDIKVQWDGVYKNDIAPIDVYVYKLAAKGPNLNGKGTKKIYKSGSVTLVI